MIRLSSLPCLALLSLLSASISRAQDLPIPIASLERTAEVDFSTEIMPILKRNCLACHHEKEAEGGLILETLDSIQTGGDSGSSVDLESPELSLLLTRTTGEEEPLMPPEDNAVGAKTLTSQELGLIKLWIEQGAKGSEMSTEQIEWQEIPESIKTSFAVAVAPDNQYAVVGRGNRTHMIKLGETNSEESDSKTAGLLIDPSVPGGNASHVDLVQSIAISPDAKRIATGGFRTVKLWSQVAAPLSQSTELLLQASGMLAVNQDQSLAAWVNPVGDIEIWNLAEAKMQRVLKGHHETVIALSWNTQEEILSADTSGRIILWDLNTDSIAAEALSAISIRSMSSSLDGRHLAIVSTDGKLYRATVEGETKQIHVIPEPVSGLGTITDAAFGQTDLPVIAVCDSTQNVIILAEDNAIVRKIDHGSAVNTISVSNRLKQLFTGGVDGITKSWNLETGEAIHQFQSDASGNLAIHYATKNSTRQNEKVARLTKQTEDLQKRLESENAVLTKATEEHGKAKTALDEKEKSRSDAATLVSTTQKTIQDAETAAMEAEKVSKAAENTLLESMKAGESIMKVLEVDTAQLGVAQKKVEALRADLDAINEQLKLAEKEAAAALQKVESQKKALEQSKQKAVESQQQIDSSSKTMMESKATIEKSTKELETQKSNLTKAEEEKSKSVTELAKKQQALDTAKEAQKRAETAIPAHQLVIEAETREKQRLEQQLQLTENKLTSVSNGLMGIAVHETEPWIATAHLDQSIRIYDVVSGQPLMRFSSETSSDSTASLKLTWLGTDLLSFGINQPTEAWSTDLRWALERTIGSPDDPNVLSDRITAMDFRNDSLSLAVGSGSPSRSGEVKVFSVETGRLIRDFGEIHSDSVLGLRFSPRGNLIASSAADKTVRLLDLASGTVKRSLEGHTHHVLAIAWQDDEQTLASASSDKTIKIWDIETGEQRRTITGFGKEITSIDYVAATNQLATACADGQARLYDTSNGKSLRTFNASGDFLYSLSLSLDGKQLMASGQSGALRLWNVDDGKLIKEWP